MLKNGNTIIIKDIQLFNSQIKFVILFTVNHTICFDVSSENLVLDLLIIPKLIYFFILTTCLLNIVLILLGEILSSSLMGVKRLT